MDCGYFENLIEQMPDESLSPEESAALNEHLCRCATCRALQEAYAFLSRDLSELEEAPETLAGNVMDAIWAENRKRVKSIRRRRFAGWASAAACVALAVGVSFPLFAPKGSSSADFAMPAAMEYAAAPQAAAEEAAPAAAAPAEDTPEEAVTESRSVVAEAPLEPQIASLTTADEEIAAYSEDSTESGADAVLGTDSSLPMAAALPPANDAAPAEEAAEPEAIAAEPEAAMEEAPEAEPVEAEEAPDPEPTAAPADIDSLLAAICVPGGESLPLTEFEMEHRFEHNGLVYEFLLWDGRLWWRCGSETSPSLSPAGEAELFALIN